MPVPHTELIKLLGNSSAASQKDWIDDLSTSLEIRISEKGPESGFKVGVIMMLKS